MCYVRGTALLGKKNMLLNFATLGGTPAPLFLVMVEKPKNNRPRTGGTTFLKALKTQYWMDKPSVVHTLDFLKSFPHST